MNILLTGYTGNLGWELARALQPHRIFALVRDPDAAPGRRGVELIEGSLEALPQRLRGELDAIIHGAASTAFRAPRAELALANVDGTARLVEFARQCPRLRRFIHLSTICVCGARGGSVREEPIIGRGPFVNAYEETKWEAEQLVLAATLPAEIARISIVAGRAEDGAVRRPGALHHPLYWFFKGLIPMLPARGEARVDLISTEYAARAVAALLHEKSHPGRIVHVAAGASAPRVAELVDFLAEVFARHHDGWARGATSRPEIVDAETFAMFEASVRQSGDLLFRRVVEDAQSFLPGLLHPRQIETSLAQTWPMDDWRALTERVFTWLLAHDWGRALQTKGDAHVLAA
jgi:nucleoside-diphosphate-sugar epimerase